MLYKILILLFISTVAFGQFTSEHTGDHIDSVITGVEDIINPTFSPSFPIGQGSDSTWDVVSKNAFNDSLGVSDSVKNAIADSIDEHSLDATQQPGFIIGSNSLWLETSKSVFRDSLDFNVFNASDNDPDSVLIFDQDGNFIYKNGDDTILIIYNTGEFLFRNEAAGLGGNVTWHIDFNDSYIINFDVGGGDSNFEITADDVMKFIIADDGNSGFNTETPNNELNVNGAFNFATDTSTSPQPNICDLVISAFSDYGSGITTGTVVYWIAGHQNTGAVNILVNAFAQKDLFKMHDQELSSGDIEDGQACSAMYDGTQWQLLSQIAQ